MAVLGQFTKQPSDLLDYNIDYSQWIEDEDQPASAAVAVTLDGAATTNIVHERTEIVGQVVRSWFSGGVAGETYKVTVATTTVYGRVKEDEYKIKMKEV